MLRRETADRYDEFAALHEEIAALRVTIHQELRLQTRILAVTIFVTFGLFAAIARFT